MVTKERTSTGIYRLTKNNGLQITEDNRPDESSCVQVEFAPNRLIFRGDGKRKTEIFKRIP